MFWTVSVPAIKQLSVDNGPVVLLTPSLGRFNRIVVFTADKHHSSSIGSLWIISSSKFVIQGRTLTFLTFGYVIWCSFFAVSKYMLTLATNGRPLFSISLSPRRMYTLTHSSTSLYKMASDLHLLVRFMMNNPLFGNLFFKFTKSELSQPFKFSFHRLSGA